MSSRADVDLTLYCVTGLPPNGWYVASRELDACV